MKTYHFTYEGIEIEYQLIRKNVKNINLRINKNAEVIVSANKHVPFEIIDTLVRSKADWIIFHLAEMEKYRQSLPLDDIYHGKTVYYLGLPYKLLIEKAEKNKILRQRFTISMKTRTPDQVETLRQQYLDWLKKGAILKFEQVLNRIYPIVQEYSIPYPNLHIKNMKSLWGSCTLGRNIICLNLQLMKTPESCIEEVLLHELIHFRYPNHGADFYALLEKLMPNYKQRQQDLETNYKDGM